MPRYANGQVPRTALVFDRHGNPWLPGTYRKWVQFQEDVHDQTGVWLYVSPKANGAYNTYRDYDGQVALRAWWGSIGMPLMASVPGKSSHGGVWTGQTNGRYGMPRYVFQIDAGAFDVANWASVPWDVFEECANRVGLRVNIVVPEERWHVVDPDPWGAPVGGLPATVGRPVTVDVEDKEEDDMFSDSDRETLGQVAAEAAKQTIHGVTFKNGLTVGQTLVQTHESTVRIEILLARQLSSGPTQFYKHGGLNSTTLWIFVHESGDFVRIRDAKTAQLYKELNGGQATVLSTEAIRVLVEDLSAAGGRDLSAVPGTTETTETVQ